MEKQELSPTLLVGVQNGTTSMGICISKLHVLLPSGQEAHNKKKKRKIESFITTAND